VTKSTLFLLKLLANSEVRSLSLQLDHRPLTTFADYSIVHSEANSTKLELQFMRSLILRTVLHTDYKKLSTLIGR